MSQRGIAEEFEQLYANSMARMQEYLATQVTEAQILDAKHHIHGVQINIGHFKWNLEQGNPLYMCRKCGALATGNYSGDIKQRMETNKTCFHCNFWENIASTPNDKRLVIEGCTYSDGGNRPGVRRDFLGFGGHVWTIQDLSSGHRWTTNNLWHGGTIPQEYRDRLPDNAKFLKDPS